MFLSQLKLMEDGIIYNTENIVWSVLHSRNIIQGNYIQTRKKTRKNSDIPDYTKTFQKKINANIINKHIVIVSIERFY